MRNPLSPEALIPHARTCTQRVKDYEGVRRVLPALIERLVPLGPAARPSQTNHEENYSGQRDRSIGEAARDPSSVQWRFRIDSSESSVKLRVRHRCLVQALFGDGEQNGAELGKYDLRGVSLVVRS